MTLNKSRHIQFSLCPSTSRSYRDEGASNGSAPLPPVLLLFSFPCPLVTRSLMNGSLKWADVLEIHGSVVVDDNGAAMAKYYGK